MLYKNAIAFSVAIAMAFTVGCSSSSPNNNDDTQTQTEISTTSGNDIKVPAGSSVTNDNVTIINGADMSVPPTDAEKITISLGLLNGPESLSVAHLLENSQKGVSYEKYTYNNYNSVKDVVDALENNKVDAATLPLNEAAKLYNKTEHRFKLAMINSLFNYCIAQNSQNISDVSQLAGKTIAVANDDEIGKIVIDKIIKDYDIKDCKITTVDDTATLVNSVADGSVSLALLQQPYISEASAKNSSVSMAIDLYDTWFEHNDADIVTGCLVVSNDFIIRNNKAFVYFMKDYDASVTITKKNIDESSQLAAKYKLASSAASAKASIPGASITCKTDNDMMTCANEFFNFVNSVNPDAIGGIVPDTSFYYLDSNQ